MAVLSCGRALAGSRVRLMAIPCLSQPYALPLARREDCRAVPRAHVVELPDQLVPVDKLLDHGAHSVAQLSLLALEVLDALR